MTYQILIKPSARRELEGLDDSTLKRVDKSILSLAENPHPRGSKKLTGIPLYRIRVGTYRILFEVNDAKEQVTIVSIGHRRDIYRR
ncbi:MAG: type II toxin-antitoxin system RelE/ParE family toxin [Nitrospirae bacterium]|nr:type II toxin-antitoxin system RelE/ParE family toxin [Nitrospirota bacterium]MDA1303249.1 type II toxin-antitoxin system RelE/ParE family toxin [Nitrospirota bacterium]